MLSWLFDGKLEGSFAVIGIGGVQAGEADERSED